MEVSSIKFDANPANMSRVTTCKKTDTHAEAIRRFLRVMRTCGEIAYTKANICTLLCSKNQPSDGFHWSLKEIHGSVLK